jgi:hypothetical protein
VRCRLSPRDGDALHNYGWFLCQQRRFDDADSSSPPRCRRRSMSTRRAPGWPVACARRVPGAGPRPRSSLAHSFELDPGNPATAFSYAEVLYRRGEYERARFYVRRINGQPGQSNAQTLWLAARIERRLGNLPGRRGFWRASCANASLIHPRRRCCSGDSSMNEPLPGPAEAPAPEPAARSAGALLKAAREREGLHLAVLAATIKVAPAKLEALERTATTNCPTPPSRVRWRSRCAGR